MLECTVASRTLLRILAVLAVAVPLAAGGPVAASADSTPGIAIDPPHGWIDPTKPNDQGRFVATTQTVIFPTSIDDYVIHSQAPKFMSPGGVVRCGIDERTSTTMTWTCEGLGSLPAPGDYLLLSTLRGEAPLPPYDVEMPITVCPLTGCSPIFDYAFAADPVVACQGAATTLTSAYDFNLPWNATAASVGTVPGAQLELLSGVPADGSALELEATFANTGTIGIPITVTDEFGGEHDASLPVTVGDCALPATGPSDWAPAGILAVLLLGAGAVLLRRRARG